MADTIYDKVFDLAKRRGFLYPAFEIYGGAAGFYDYGPLGAQLKALLEAKFRQIYVVEEGAAEISTPAITIEPVLKASGHIDHFSDVVVNCKKCGSGFRADHLIPEEAERLRALVKKIAAGEPEERELDASLRQQAQEIKDHPAPEVADRVLQEVQQIASQLQKIAERAKKIRETIGLLPKCPNCGSTEFEKPARFNLMFRTTVGPGTAKVAYLRPETAQAMFIDFPFLYRYFREQLPFAACQIGRAYRNEISPRQGLIRLREFNQMEVEAFFDPGQRPTEMTHPQWDALKDTRVNLVPNSDQKAVTMTLADAVKKQIIYNPALATHLAFVHRLLTEAGLKPDKLRFRQHLKDEMAHYAADCWDAEFHSERFDWVECVGVAYRTDFDLSQHEKHSGKPLRAMRRFPEPKRVERTTVIPIPAKLGPLFKKDAGKISEALQGLDESRAEEARTAPHLDIQLDGTVHRVPREAYDVKRETTTVHGDSFIAHVIEPSFGQDRILYGLLEHSFEQTIKEGEAYTVLRLPAAMAPITVGIFPLMAKDGLDAMAQEIEHELRQEGLRVGYDDGGAIGRRYARADEVGTPFAVTVDYDSLKDQTVTLRDRDTTKQVRVPRADLVREIRRRLAAPATRPAPVPSPRAEAA